MELLLLLSTLLLLCLIFFLSFKFLKKSDCNSSNLPPGKNGWPFLGETLEFLSAGRKGTPEKFFNDRMHRHSSKIFTTSLFCEQTAVLCGAAGNKFLFSNDNKLVTAWWPRSVDKIFPSSVAHTSQESLNLRRLVMSSLKPDSLQSYVGIMDSVAKHHLDAHWDSGEDIITVLPLAKKFTFALACRLFLSIRDPKHVARFEEPFTTLLLGIFSVPINLPGTPFNRAIRAADLIRKELLEIIKQRKQEMTAEETPPNRDILTHMLTATDENGRFMSELDVADKVIGVLIGGHDTASTAITFIVKYLAEMPEIYQRVLKEQSEAAEGKAEGEMLNWDDLQKMKYSWNVACEVMRLAPPFQGNFREAVSDFSYAGFSIPKGWKLYWNVNTTHKNPDYFVEPEKFDPSRFEGNGPVPYSYVPFGGGPRMCPGKEYARLEILSFIHNLVTKFKWEKVLQHEKIVINHMPLPANGLPVRMYRH